MYVPTSQTITLKCVEVLSLKMSEAERMLQSFFLRKSNRKCVGIEFSCRMPIIQNWCLNNVHHHPLKVDGKMSIQFDLQKTVYLSFFEKAEGSNLPEALLIWWSINIYADGFKMQHLPVRSTPQCRRLQHGHMGIELQEMKKDIFCCNDTAYNFCSSFALFLLGVQNDPELELKERR